VNDYAKAYTHEHKGRWIVAQHQDDQYIAPHTPEAYRLTGCSASFGSLAYVYGDNIYSYARRADAVRRARELYGFECIDCGRVFVPGPWGETACPKCGDWHWKDGEYEHGPDKGPIAHIGEW